MFRVIKRVKNVLIWNRAVEYSARRDWMSALGELARMDPNNLSHLKQDYSLFAAYNALRAGDKEWCRRLIAEALTVLEKAQRLSTSEKAYRKKYAESVVASIVGPHAGAGVSFEGVDLAEVSSRTKQLFPLRRHPKWKEP